MWSASPFSSKPKPTILKPTIIHVKSIGERDLVDTVWNAVGKGRQLTWKMSAIAKISAKVQKDCRKTMDEIKTNLNLNSKNAVAPVVSPSSGLSAAGDSSDGLEDVLGIAGAEVVSFAGELGLDLPVLRQAMAVVRLGIAVGRVAKSSYDLKQFYTAYQGVEAIAVTKLAGTALKGMLQKELVERSVSVATSTLDLVVSLSDPTSVSSGGFKATAKLAYRLVQLYRSYKLVNDVNAMLSDRALFDITILGRMPLLGCYLFPNVETSQLLGVFYDMKDDMDPEDRQHQTKNILIALDKPKIEKLYQQNLKPLEKLAQGRIQNAPYLLQEKKSLAGRI